MSKGEMFLGWLTRWWRSLVIMLAAGAAFGGAFWGAEVQDGPGRVWLFMLGIAGALVAAFLPIAENKALYAQIDRLKLNVEAAKTEGEDMVLQARRESREDFLLIFDFALKPLLNRLGPLVRSKQGSRRRGVLAAELKMTALSALKEVINPSIPMLRANYFKLRYDDTGAPYLREFGSTAVPPRERFLLGTSTEESDALVEMLAKDAYVFTEDCQANPPRGFDNSKTRSYETFISSAATDGYDVDGMLTVDSPEAGSITEADAVLVRLVATIIALSEAVNDGKRSDSDEN